MPHDTPLISAVVVGLVLAFLFGTLANRLRMPPIVGYLLAGVAVGPLIPGFGADAGLAGQLAELGVILLMFGMGLRFSLRDLLGMRATAIPGALVQIGGGTLLGLGLALLLGWSIGAGLVLGLALSVASTVVLLRALQDRRMLDSERGRIAAGWLTAENLIMVLALVLIPATAGMFGGTDGGIHDPFVSFVERLLGTGIGLGGVLALTVLKLAAFVGFMLVVGRRIIPWTLHRIAHTGNRELSRLAVLAIALAVAAGAAYLFGVSLALGAFFAGMILSESELSRRAASETLPLRDAFGVLFFVAIGMLFDPAMLLANPLPVLGAVLIIMAGRFVLAFITVMAFRHSVGTALTVSASLAQIGEFSFILAALGVGLGIMPPEANGLIVAGILISVVLNPAMFWLAGRLQPRLESRAGWSRDELAAAERIEPGLSATGSTAAAPAASATPRSGHSVIVGYGRVGRGIAAALAARQQPFVIIEDAESRVTEARAAGREVIAENAATPHALALAGMAAASRLLVAIPDAFEAGQVVEQSRRLNPGLRIIARGQSGEAEAYLAGRGADIVIVGEPEIARGMVDSLALDAASHPTAPPPPAEPELDERASDEPPRLPPSDNIIAAAPSIAVTGALAADMAEQATLPDEIAEPEQAAIEDLPVIEPLPEPLVPPLVDPDTELEDEAMLKPIADDPRAAADEDDFAQADVSPEFYDSAALALENAVHLEAEPGNPDQTPQSDPAPELPGIPPSEAPPPATPPSEVPPPPVPNENPMPPEPAPGPGPIDVPPITPDPGTVPGEVPTVPEQPPAPPGNPPTVAEDTKASSGEVDTGSPSESAPDKD